MNARIIFTIVAGLTFGVGTEANARDWADFSQSNGSVGITSANRADATVLRTVTVVCPVKGYLIARADAEFNLTQGSTAGRAIIGYSLTLDSVAPIAFDGIHGYLTSGYDPDGFMDIPASMQRIVSCTARQSVTVNYVAFRHDAGADSFAVHPRLSVDLFDKRI